MPPTPMAPPAANNSRAGDSSLLTTLSGDSRMSCSITGTSAIAAFGGNQGGCPFRYLWLSIKAALMKHILFIVPVLAILCGAMPLSAQVSASQGYDPYRRSPEKRKAARDEVCRRVGEGA